MFHCHILIFHWNIYREHRLRVIWIYWEFCISSVQFSHSVVSDSVTPWITARQASLSITNSQSSHKLMCIQSVMPSSHLILCPPLFLLPPIPPRIRAFSIYIYIIFITIFTSPLGCENTTHLSYILLCLWTQAFSCYFSFGCQAACIHSFIFLVPISFSTLLMRILHSNLLSELFLSSNLLLSYTVPRFSVVIQLLSRVWLLETPWSAARQASLSFTVSWILLKFISIESVMPTNYLILCCSLLLLPSIFPSIKVLSNESALCLREPKDWSFNISISPSNEYSELISFRIDWFDLFVVQETLESLLQCHNSKSLIL